MRIKRLTNTAIIPEYQTKGSAAFDICSDIDISIAMNELKMVTTGIAVEVPKGYVLSIRQRSGLSVKYPNYLSIGVGTIDSDYRGELFVPIINKHLYNWNIKRGDRIVQGIIHPVIQVKFYEVNELSKTERGESGFGSTGI